jgi:hypothetical protein
MNIPESASQNAIDIYKGQRSPLIMILGNSGRGKSTAIRTLDPASTFIISVIGKPMPFPGGMRYVNGENMYIGSDPTAIKRAMMDIDKRRTNFKQLVIDDGQYIMATEFMNQALVKGYDKYSIMARNIWEILILSTKLRGDLKVFFLCHEEDTGAERRMKTLGKLLAEKITPEGLSTVVLFSEVAGERDARKYFFATQSDGVTNAKSPFDMFPPQIPNDLDLVVKRMDEYYTGVPLAKSKLNFTL